MDKDREQLLRTAKQAAMKAGEEIARIYRTYRIEDITNYKEDKSPITIADTAANQIILDTLAHLHIPTLSEEGEKVSYLERKNWNQYWLIDPLDGTREFIKKNDNFTVNIALIEENRPTIGIIYSPIHQSLYIGDVESKAYKIDCPDAESQPLKVSPVSDDDGIRAFKSRSHSSFKDINYLEQFNVKETLQIGSSIKFCLLAEGKAEIYYRDGTTMEWDTAAGEAILKAAGGHIIQADNHEPLAYNKKNLENPPFCAMNAKLFDLF